MPSMLSLTASAFIRAQECGGVGKGIKERGKMAVCVFAWCPHTSHTCCVQQGTGGHGVFNKGEITPS